MSIDPIRRLSTVKSMYISDKPHWDTGTQHSRDSRQKEKKETKKDNRRGHI